MRGKSFGTDLKCMCICANTHLDGVWISPLCQSYICRRAVQVGSLKKSEREQQEEERQRGEAGLLMHWG